MPHLRIEIKWTSLVSGAQGCPTGIQRLERVKGKAIIAGGPWAQ